jgi:hypothetical protein
MDDRAIALISQYNLSARRADLVVALCDVTHAILAPKDAYEVLLFDKAGKTRVFASR